MSEFVGVVTTIGQQKIAAAIGGAALNLTTIRVGDGNGVPIVPAPGMTDLVRRVGAAYPIISSGRDPVNLTHWRVTALIPAADGPFDIREIGVFDAAGNMIAIAKHVLVEKRSPAQGAAVELTTDIVFPVSETAHVTVQIQPSAAVSILQMLRAGFCSVESAQVANPPANPALGVTYVVAAAATGAWVGLTNRLVQWNGTVWVSIDPPAGFLVVAQDRALDHSGRWLRRIAGGWASARAAEDALGVVELATAAEVRAGVDGTRAVTPATLSQRVATENVTGLTRRATAGEISAGTAGGHVEADQLAAALQTVSPSNIIISTTSGSYSPGPNVVAIHVTLVGGGGAGGVGPSGHWGGGGGSAAVVEAYFGRGDLLASNPYTVGAGGAGNPSASSLTGGYAGGNTTFGGMTAGGGGGGGTSESGHGVGGAGGVATITGPGRGVGLHGTPGPYAARYETPSALGSIGLGGSPGTIGVYGGNNGNAGRLIIREFTR